jgi:tetratricopeptide (TPR) repeat protein
MAARMLEAVVNEDIDDSAARRLLAWTLWKLERFEEAAIHFRDLMIEVPGDVNASYSLADCLVALNRYAEAIPILQRLTSLDPSDADALNLLATAHVARGEYQDALFCYRRTIRLAPNDPVELTNYAATLMALGHNEEAVEVARKALSLRPHAATAFNLAGALIRLKQWSEAVEAFRQAVELEPSNADTRVDLAIALAGAHRYDEAATVLGEVIQGNPNGRALAMLSHVHHKRGLDSDAIEAGRLAVQAAPKLLDAHLALGFALVFAARPSEALESFNEAQRLKPNDAYAELGRAGALSMMGEHCEALAAFDHALSQDATGLESYPEMEPLIAESRRHAQGSTS